MDIFDILGQYASAGTEELDSLCAAISAMGPAGVVATVVLFALSTWMWVPGLVPMTLAFMVYGPVGGAVVSVVGGLLAMTHSFLAIRTLAWRAVEIPDNRLLRHALGHLEAHPVVWVSVLRAVFWLSPVVTSTLALSPIRFRDYALGSVLGFVPAVVTMVTVLSWSITG